MVRLVSKIKNKILMRHSLKYRVALATALVVTFIILARALFAQYYAFQSLTALRQAQQETLVKLVAEQLDEKFETRAIALRRLAHQLAPMLGQPPADLRRFATQAMSMPQIFNAVFLALPDGDMVFSTAVPIGKRIHRRGLDLLVGTYNFLDLTPKGRNESGPMSWMKFHDKY